MGGAARSSRPGGARAGRTAALRGASDADLPDHESAASKLSNKQDVQASVAGPSPSAAPLLEAVAARAARRQASLHVPGHKRGGGAPDSFLDAMGTRMLKHDLTELSGLDFLAAPDGVILEAQELAAEAFGADRTWFLVNGSTVGIHAAVLSTCKPGDKVILARNCHQSAYFACILAGVEPVYAAVEVDTGLGVAHGITAKSVQEALASARGGGAHVGSVLIVSPTYFGACSDVRAIADVCHDNHVPLVVDEAHGAHLGLLPSLPRSAMQQGADLAVQSTHKVLGSMTQSAMLHVRGARVCHQRVSRALQMLQSSSPSYVLLSSLDAARQQVHAAGSGAGVVDNFLETGYRLGEEARRRISAIPGLGVVSESLCGRFGVAALDPMRVTVDLTQLSLTGYDVDALLDQEHEVAAEISQPSCITFVFTGGNTEADVCALVSGLHTIAQRNKLNSDTSFIKGSQGATEMFLNLLRIQSQRMTPRSAFFSCSESVPVNQAVGRVSAELICPYPPGIPVVAPGEMITIELVQGLLQIKSMGGRIGGVSDSSLEHLVVVVESDAAVDETVVEQTRRR